MRLQKQMIAGALVAVLAMSALSACGGSGVPANGSSNSGSNTSNPGNSASEPSSGSDNGSDSGSTSEPAQDEIQEYRIEKYNASHQFNKYTHQQTVVETNTDSTTVGRTFIVVSDGVRLANYDITDQYKNGTIYDTEEKKIYSYLDYFSDDDTKMVSENNLPDGIDVLKNEDPSREYNIRNYGYGGKYGAPVKAEKKIVNNTLCYCETIMSDEAATSGSLTYCFALDDTEGKNLLYVIHEWGGQYCVVYKIDKYINTVEDWSMLQVPEGYEIWTRVDSNGGDANTGKVTGKDNYPNR